MASQYNTEINGIVINIRSENWKRPDLFDLTATIDGKKYRWHMQRFHGTLKFCQIDRVPDQLKHMEKEMAYEAEVGWRL
jgi:hypothetical protein